MRGYPGGRAMASHPVRFAHPPLAGEESARRLLRRRQTEFLQRCVTGRVAPRMARVPPTGLGESPAGNAIRFSLRQPLLLASGRLRPGIWRIASRTRTTRLADAPLD